MSLKNDVRKSKNNISENVVNGNQLDSKNSKKMSNIKTYIYFVFEIQRKTKYKFDARKQYRSVDAKLLHSKNETENMKNRLLETY